VDLYDYAVIAFIPADSRGYVNFLVCVLAVVL